MEILNEINDFIERNSGNSGNVNVVKPVTNNDNIQEFYRRLESLNVNMSELKDIFDCNDNLLVLAGAGSGKSTGIMLKLIHDLLDGSMMKVSTVETVYGKTQVVVPAKILVCTFLRTGALELRQVFLDWCKKLGIANIDMSNIQFKTIHAEVKDAITQMGVNVEVLENTDSLVRSVMSKYGIRSNMAISKNITVEEVKDVASIIAYARNRLDDKKYEHPLMSDYGLNKILLDGVMHDFALMRRMTGKLDFEDMQELLLEALQFNPNVQEFIKNRYDYIFVDEFQDTSQLQYEILKYYFSGAKRVTVIGDDDQSIYSWRGSDIEIITKRFFEDFKPEIRKLTTNYRCKSNILNFTVPSIELNSNRHPKSLKSYVEGGKIEIVDGIDVVNLVSKIKEDLANGMSVGVLARTNADLLVPTMLLELDGTVEFAVSKAVTMDNRLCRQVFGVIDLILKRVTPEFEDLFKIFLPYNKYYEAQKLADVLTINKDVNLFSIPGEDLKASVPTLYPFLGGLRKAMEFGKVDAYLYILGHMKENVYNGESVYAYKARELVKFVEKIILHHPVVKDLELFDIDNLFNNVLPERIYRRAKYGNDRFVKLTTVHEAKGKEWDSVYIWNDIEGNFPNKVGYRELTEEEIEEERRIHYIAVTRAKEKLTIFTDSNAIGMFLKECDWSYVDRGNDVGLVRESVKMVKVFKKRDDVDIDVDFDDLLRSRLKEYIDFVTSLDFTDSRHLNMLLILKEISEDEVYEKVKKAYDGLSVDSISDEDLDKFFDELAGNILLADFNLESVSDGD